MNYKSILYEKKGSIGYLKLNRPDNGNALNRAMADELAVCCQMINQDGEIRAVVLGGEGSTFCIGEDINDVGLSGIAADALASLKMPVIAAINGDAIDAGLELALACDLRLSTDTANFGIREVARGLIPSGGGTQRLPRVVGRGKAFEMILTADIANANEAYRIGLVNKVLLASELQTEVEELAEKIASKGPIAERYAKEAIGKGLDMTLGQGLGLEADLSFILQSTKDRTEGIEAFLRKRTPEFKGE